MERVLVLLITLALLVGMVGCPAEPEPGPPVQYSLSISSTEGGSVSTPGEGTFTFSEGATANLVAVPASGYSFGGWTGDVSTVANTRAASTTITMNGDYSITATFQVIPVARYDLTVSSTEGGSVTAPGEGTFTYDAGTVVELLAKAEEGYQFTYWTGGVAAIDDVNAVSTTVTVMGGYTITANFAKEVRTWCDLDAIREDLSGHYVLVNDLDDTTAGYHELAGPAANGSKGWEPIGSLLADPDLWDIVDPVRPFTGRFDGRGYQIRALYIARPEEEGVALFGLVGQGGVVQNTGVVNGEVIGRVYVGGLVGVNHGTTRNSYSTASVTGVGSEGRVGGLVGQNQGAITRSYSDGSVSSYARVGGLVGQNYGTVSDSYFGGTVSGERWVGGLVGLHLWGTMANSYYNCDEVRINGKRVITIGALFAEDFEHWLAHNMFLEVDERLFQENGYYLINTVGDFKQLLVFGQDSSLRFRLATDLDLSKEPDFYIPYLAGEFDGHGHRISNLNFSHEFTSHVGLFGYVAQSGKVTGVGVDNVSIVGGEHIGGLVGVNFGAVSDSYSSGNVAGRFHIGGLLGGNWGTLSNSWFSSGRLTGLAGVRGLIGENERGAVSNSHYNYDEVLINGQKVVTIGALYGADFAEWLANDGYLDINERLLLEDGYYVIDSVSDFRQLLAFGQDSSLKFRLTNDLDLSGDPNFYIPYLAGEFDGSGHQIANLSVRFDFADEVGLFGVLTKSGKVSDLHAENVDVRGWWDVGGLVGQNYGTVTNCRSSGSVAGHFVDIGGLVGGNQGQVNNSYSSARVSGGWRAGGVVGANWWGGTVSNSYSSGSVSGNGQLGGLVGWNESTVSSSFSAGSVDGEDHVGGLVGHNPGSVGNSFWDVETSGQAASAGGTGKTTAEMKNVTTFSGAGWSIIAVASAEARNISRAWNIVEGQTYPFLSWQPVS